jgi:hypothetical protein
MRAGDWKRWFTVLGPKRSGIPVNAAKALEQFYNFLSVLETVVASRVPGT